MNLNPINNVSFGMAKFSSAGKRRAQDLLKARPNKYLNDKYYQNPTLSEPALLKTIEKHEDGQNQDEVTKLINEYGTTPCADKNAAFIKGQILKPFTKSYIESLRDKKSPQENQEYAYKLLNAFKGVFIKNWDNPRLSNSDTSKLLDFISPTLKDKEYAQWQGVLKTAEAKKIRTYA